MFNLIQEVVSNEKRKSKEEKFVATVVSFDALTKSGVILYDGCEIPCNSYIDNIVAGDKVRIEYRNGNWIVITAKA